MLAGSAISWKTSKQTITATSTFQAEYIAIYEATLQALWLRNFGSKLELIKSIQRPITIYCDNALAVFFAKNNRRTSHSRNIDVKYYSVRESVEEKAIKVIKIGTQEQLADPFTKVLPASIFVTYFRNMVISDKLDVE